MTIRCRSDRDVPTLYFRKILVSVKLFVRNSGAGNGCANFMGAWKNAFFLQEKPMSIKFLVLGGGGEVPILCYGREDFSEYWPAIVARNLVVL